MARGVQGPATRAPGGGPGGFAPWKPSDFKHITIKNEQFQGTKIVQIDFTYMTIITCKMKNYQENVYTFLYTI